MLSFVSYTASVPSGGRRQHIAALRRAMAGNRHGRSAARRSPDYRRYRRRADGRCGAQMTTAPPSPISDKPVLLTVLRALEDAQALQPRDASIKW